MNDSPKEVPSVVSTTTGKVTSTEAVREQLEGLRINTLAQLIQVLHRIPEYTDTTLKEMDKETKQKRPLDKAFANLHLLQDISEQTPLAQEFILKRKARDFDQYVLFEAKTGFRGDVLSRFALVPNPSSYASGPGLYFIENIGHKNDLVKSRQFISEERLAAWIKDDEKKQLVTDLGELSIEDIAKGFYQAMEYAPKEDDPIIDSLIKQKAKAEDFVTTSWGETLSVIDSPDKYQSPDPKRKIIRVGSSDKA